MAAKIIITPLKKNARTERTDRRSERDRESLLQAAEWVFKHRRGALTELAKH